MQILTKSVTKEITQLPVQLVFYFISPQKGILTARPKGAVSKALFLVRYKAVDTVNSFLYGTRNNPVLNGSSDCNPVQYFEDEDS